MKKKSTEFWQIVSKNKLFEKCGKGTFLGKNEGKKISSSLRDLARQRNRKDGKHRCMKFIIARLDWSKSEVLGSGRDAREALIDAGLEKWVQSIELNERAKQ